jgi:hypothetical protein
MIWEEAATSNAEIVREERANGRLTADLSSPFWEAYQFQLGQLAADAKNMTRVLKRFRKQRTNAELQSRTRRLFRCRGLLRYLVFGQMRDGSDACIIIW